MSPDPATKRPKNPAIQQTKSHRQPRSSSHSRGSRATVAACLGRSRGPPRYRGASLPVSTRTGQPPAGETLRSSSSWPWFMISLPQQMLESACPRTRVRPPPPPASFLNATLNRPNHTARIQPPCRHSYRRDEVGAACSGHCQDDGGDSEHGGGAGENTAPRPATPKASSKGARCRTGALLHQYRGPGVPGAPARASDWASGYEGSQAQQDVGIWLRKRPATMRRLSAMVRYGAQVSARSSTVMPALMA